MTSPGLCPVVTLASALLPQDPRTSVPSASPLGAAMPPRGSRLMLPSFRKPLRLPWSLGCRFLIRGHSTRQKAPNHTRPLAWNVHGSEAGGLSRPSPLGPHKAHSRFRPATLRPAGSGATVPGSRGRWRNSELGTWRHLHLGASDVGPSPRSAARPRLPSGSPFRLLPLCACGRVDT